MTITPVRRGWQGAVLKALRAQDFRLELLSREAVSEHYLRLRFRCAELFRERPEPHPTMWLRLWFSVPGAIHQRAYTLVDPDPATGEFDLEFALHTGPACRWARDAEPGTTIEATLLGSAAPQPETDPARWLLVGDTASLPAINSMLDAIGDVPVQLFCEYQRDGEQHLPVRATPATQVTWLPRDRAGAGLADAVVDALEGRPTDGLAAWVACDTVSTRRLVGTLRRHGLPKKMIISQGYWVPPGD